MGLAQAGDSVGRGVEQDGVSGVDGLMPRAIARRVLPTPGETPTDCNIFVLCCRVRYGVTSPNHPPFGRLLSAVSFSGGAAGWPGGAFEDSARPFRSDTLAYPGNRNPRRPGPE